MKMQALVALRNLTYAGRNVKAGRTFQASPRDAKLLTILKRAQVDPAVDPASIKKEAPAREAPVVAVVADAVKPATTTRRYGARAKRESSRIL